MNHPNPDSNLKPQNSNLKPQTSNLKPQTSNKYSEKASAKSASPFEVSLVDYIDSYLVHGGTASEKQSWPGWDQTGSLSELLGRYDYSGTYGHLIPTVPGYHRDINLHKYGHMRIRKILEEEGSVFPNSHVNVPSWKAKAMKMEGREESGSVIVCQFSSFSQTHAGFREQLQKSFSAGCSQNSSKLGPAALEFVWPTSEEVQSLF